MIKLLVFIYIAKFVQIYETAHSRD